MGLSIDRSVFTDEEYVQADGRLRENLEALKLLLQRPGFGIGEPSLGAELEMCIIDENALALPLNREILAESMDPHLQLELDRFNLEYNLSPVQAEGNPFQRMESELDTALKKLDRIAGDHGGRIIAIGILPTLTMQHLQASSMTDLPRYHALSNGIKRIRNEEFRIRIDGDDPLDEICEQIALEGANTSLQVHLRVDPDDFAATYNAAQLVTPLALAVGANSPLFLGHRLWQETRIALFKQAVDTRGATNREWRRAARVPFGHGWARQGAYELFAESCRIYPILIPLCSGEDPLEVVNNGGIPELAELRLQQGTIWNWNRAVYDSADGGHVRIEFRALPSGPTPVDMMANAAFIIGLSIGLRDRIDELISAMPFRYAEYNFYRAAQAGLDAEILWPALDTTSPVAVSVAEKCMEMLPVADAGLSELQVDKAERDRLLGIIQERLVTNRTAAQWQRNKLQEHLHLGSSEALVAVTEEYLKNAQSRLPVAQWQ
jgi:gamma-glutamyl:cysteine ligase YbdK (ATP-grasp superfamily)